MSTPHRLIIESRRRLELDAFNLPELYVPEGPSHARSETDVSQKFPSLIRSARYIASPLCRALVDFDVPLKTPSPFIIVKGSEFKFLTKKYGWHESERLLDKFASDHSGPIDISVSDILAETDKRGQPKLVAHIDYNGIEKLRNEFAASEEFLLTHGAKPFQRQNEKFFSAITIANFDTWSDCSRAQISIMNFLEHDVDRNLLHVAPSEIVSPLQS